MKQVSVIVPVRNREKLVGRAVRSILTQTARDLEIIVVDDGSTDNTSSTVAIIARDDARVHLLRHNFSRGAQAARNTGIQAARGEWIAFLDSDDQWYPNSLDVRLRLAMKNGLPIVHSECYVIDHDGTEIQQFKVPAFQGRVYRELLRRPGPMFQGLLVRKDCFCRIGGLDENITSYQEWDTSIRLAKYYEFGFVPEPTFLYDCRHADTISKESLRQAQGYEQVFTKHFWPILRVLGPGALVQHYQTAAHLYCKANDERNAQRCSMSAFLSWPFQPRAILRGVQHLLQSRL